MFTIILFAIITAIFFILLVKLLALEKNHIISILISIFIIIFIFNINTCIEATFNGLNLVIKAIVPTLFPFSVICNLLIYYDGISLYSKILGPILCKPLNLSKTSSFPIVVSVLCGYPLGCKYCCDLYELGYINKDEFTRLLNIASNASPIFLIGSVGVAMFGNIKFGLILLISNYIAPLIIGFFTRKYSTPASNELMLTKKNSNTNFGAAIKAAVENGINTTLQVGAFIVIFSIIISVIKNNAYVSIIISNIENFFNLPTSSIYGVFLGSIEYTNGCKILINSSLSIPIKLSSISFICAFSGLSIIAQISSFVSKYNISLGMYSLIKLIQGILSFIITFIISYIFLDSKTVSTFQNTITFNYTTASSIILLLLLIPLLLKLSYYVIRKLHIS